MKILWLSRWDSRNPTDGQLLYSEGLISSLEQLGAYIQVIATSRSDCDARPPQSMRTIVNPAVSPRSFSLFTSIPSDAFKQRSADFKSALQRALDSAPDVIVFDYYATGWALPIVQRHCRKMGTARPLLVYLSHNHEASLRQTVALAYKGNPLLRMAVKRDAQKASDMENALVSAADLVTTNTDEDTKLYQESAPEKQYFTVTPAYSGATRAAGHIRSATSRRVIMMGSMLWIAKQENLRRFVVAAHDQFLAAGIELYVLGRSDPAFLASIERQSSVVKALGFVDDPLPYLYDSRIGVMPDELGGGFKHRVVNYIFNGVPVATIRSQAAGLPVDLDRDLISADTLDQLVRDIVDAIDDLDRLNAMAQQAQEKCEDKFDWLSRGRALLNILELNHKILANK
jgi:glycosyltransferase involved in cell wall biosynthesis